MGWPSKTSHRCDRSVRIQVCGHCGISSCSRRTGRNGTDGFDGEAVISLLSETGDDNHPDESPPSVCRA